MPGNTGPWGAWAGFQYTDQGRVAGIEGNVDRNLFRSTILIGNWEPVTGTEAPGDNGANIGSSVYIVRLGDTLSEIAQKFDSSVNAIAQLNGIQNVNLIYAGEHLRIPESGESGDRIYIVRQGDTLSEIARQFGSTISVIARRNGIQNVNLIYSGERLHIPEGVAQKVYIVRPGDTLSGIAQHFSTTVQAVAKQNGIKNPNRIYVGQRLIIE